ncbi:MAG: TlpA family protein disulfide reductase [Planctomycetales bacterium]|nr:TlpA family protein disulfide reductase [Planctomycetales bacterium]MBN8624403.1 TlpA family protein disulfide reductase [Planctomycetota bacterium]
MSIVRYLALAAVLGFVGCEKMSGGAASAGGSPGGSVAGKPAGADVAATAAAGGDVKLDLKSSEDLQKLVASKKGKVVVVDAWSTYCDPCMKEFPGLVGLHKKYGPEKIACISFCMNYVGLGKVEDEIEPVIEFLRKQNATFDNILSTDEDTMVNKKLGIQSVPAIFIYDRDGKLVKLINTETTYAEVEEIVAPLLN